MPDNNNIKLIISYLTMRRLIGILGIALPVVVVLGGFIQNGYEVQSSISQYYYTNMRDYFVGLLCAVALFLLSYKGYKNDNIYTNLSGLFALGIAFFPTGLETEEIMKVGLFQLDDNLSMIFHLTCAALFFITLAYISIFLFTKSDKAVLNDEKKKRNRIYIICGYVMLGSIACILIYLIFLQNTSIANIKPILLFEGFALIGFGVSWLIKGETLFTDKKAK